MGGTIRWDTSAVASAVKSIERARGALEGSASPASPSGCGRSSSDAADVVDRFQTAITRLEKSLDRLTTALTDSSASMEEADGAVSDSMTGGVHQF